jgi:hypothetical protein
MYWNFVAIDGVIKNQWNIRIICEYAFDFKDKKGTLPELIVFPELCCTKFRIKETYLWCSERRDTPGIFSRMQTLEKDNFADEIFQNSGLGTVLVTLFWLLPDIKLFQREVNNLAHITLALVVTDKTFLFIRSTELRSFLIFVT